jgi:hypothetical protein
VTECAVVIDLSEAKVLKGHVADFSERLFNVDRALPNLFEEGAELSFIHEVSA